jgi:hypothetical protein
VNLGGVCLGGGPGELFLRSVVDTSRCRANIACLVAAGKVTPWAAGGVLVNNKLGFEGATFSP